MREKIGAALGPRELLFFSGVLLLAGGAALVFVPAGLMVAGASLVWRAR